MYPVLKPTIRMKKTAHDCRITDLRTDAVNVAAPSTCFILSLCNGLMDIAAIARCVVAAYGMDAPRAVSYVSDTLEKQSRQHRVDWLPQPRLIPSRYQMQDFFYAPLPIGEPFRRVSPIGATLVLTHQCNYRCVYCYNSSGAAQPPGLSTEQWLEAVRQLGETTDCFSVGLTGGEPMLHPGFFDIVEAIYSQGMVATIATNGSLIDEEAIRRLKACGQGFIQISLDSALPGLHHRMTASQHTHARVLQAMKDLVGAGITVNCKALISSLNCKEVDRLLLLLDDLGVSAVMLDTFKIKSRGRGNTGLWMSAQQRQDMQAQVENTRPKLKTLQVSYGEPECMWTGPDDMVACGGMCETITIMPDGQYVLCEDLANLPDFYLGRFPQNAIMEVWSSPAVARLLFPPADNYDPTCRSCPQLGDCRGGCFAAKQMVHAAPGAPDPRCWRASYENNPWSVNDEISSL